MPIRVVIAEDEAIIRLDLKETLQEEGYDVIAEATRGDEAVKLVCELKPDLVIVDIKMPVMDGLQAAKEIASCCPVALVVLTALSQRNLIEQARDAGALAYLVKPFRKLELTAAIELALARFNEMRALEEEFERLDQDHRYLSEKLEIRKVLDRAKGKLMDIYSMTESQAFSFIQRYAMDNRTSIKEVAHQVVDGGLAPPSASLPGSPN
ncbi:MAG: response regulator [Actinobacteria bacterium]|nr:response regulator [Actinomycetota bacterium]MCL6105197.1 response regulator [Actinomycetota bacterium]